MESCRGDVCFESCRGAECIWNPVGMLCILNHAGVLSIFCSTLLEHLDQLPGDARTLVGLLTFDSTLHFYSFNVRPIIVYIIE